MSDSSAVDRLREQLNIALSASCRDPLTVWQRAGAITALFPVIAAFGDAREAAGREQAAQAIRDHFETGQLGRSRWAEVARGSGVAVQPTPGKQP
jgi:hypothetical protein